MKDFFAEDSKYKIVAKLSIISVTTLLMMFAGTASFSSYYHPAFAAAKNATSSSSSSTSKGGGSSSSNSTSPIGSSTFLNVITKVDNSKGGTSKPSDFTISVSGKSPSPKSFSGSSSGTSVTLKAGKYKVTGSGTTGYTTKYSSGCSGTASGGTPIKCTISASYSQPSPSPSPSGSNNTSTAKTPSQLLGAGDDCKYFDNCMYITIKGFIKRSDCHYQVMCPELNHHKITVEGYYIYDDGKEHMYQEKHSFTPTNAGTTIAIGVLGSQHKNWDSGYRITAECVTIIQEGSGAPIDCGPASNVNFRAQSAFIYGGTGTCASTGGADAYSAVTCQSTPTKTDIRQTTNINFHWACTVSFPKFC